MATQYNVGEQYKPTNFVRTGAAPGQLYDNASWGISASNPGTLKEVRTINGVQYGDFQFKSGSGWAKLSDLQFAQPTTAQPVTNKTATTAQTLQKKPTQAQEIDPYLANFQKLLSQQLDDFTQAQKEYSKKSDTQRIEEIKKQIMPEGDIPEAPKLADIFEQQREKYNLDQLEGQINDLTAQEEEIYATLRQRKTTEEGKPVALNVIQGRISEAERQEYERLDYVSRVKNNLVNQVNSAYGVIDTIINLTNTDFQNAKATWQLKFDTKLSIYEAMQTEKKYEQDRLDKIKQNLIDNGFEASRINLQYLEFIADEDQRQQNNARANLEIYIDLVKDGGMTFDSLPSQTKIEISKLEAQSGLGVGFLSRVRSLAPDQNVVSTTTRQDASGMKYADVILQNRDGSITTKTISLGMERLPEGSSGTNDQEKIEKAISAGYKDAVTLIESIDNNYWTSGDGNLNLRSEYEREENNKDTQLSASELDLALREVQNKVTGGDQDLAYELVYRVLKDNHYSYWEPNGNVTPF